MTRILYTLRSYSRGKVERTVCSPQEEWAEHGQGRFVDAVQIIQLCVPGRLDLGGDRIDGPTRIRGNAAVRRDSECRNFIGHEDACSKLILDNDLQASANSRIACIRCFEYKLGPHGLSGSICALPEVSDEKTMFPIDNFHRGLDCESWTGGRRAIGLQHTPTRWQGRGPRTNAQKRPSRTKTT